MKPLSLDKRAHRLAIFFAIYAVALVLMNTVATKQIELGPFATDPGIFVSPLVFIAQDVVTELYGRKTARRMVYAGFVLLAISVVVYQIAMYLPAAYWWESQAAFEAVFSTTPRIALASLAAYLVGSLIDVEMMARMKVRWPDALFVRALGSTVVGQLVDNALFTVLAFALDVPWEGVLAMIVTSTVLEIGIEAGIYPATRKIIMANRDLNSTSATQ